MVRPEPPTPRAADRPRLCVTVSSDGESSGVSAERAYSPPQSPAPKRRSSGGHAARASRFTVTYYGAGVAAALGSQEEKKSPPRPDTPRFDGPGSQESAVERESPGGDEDPLPGGDGRVGPCVPDVSPAAVRLSDDLRSLLQADHQVRAGSALCSCPFILHLPDSGASCPLHCTFF